MFLDFTLTCLGDVMLAISKADTLMGLNIAVGDVDTEAQGSKTFGLRHEMWPCGTKAGRTNMTQFCNFYMMQGKLPAQP